MKIYKNVDKTNSQRKKHKLYSRNDRKNINYEMSNLEICGIFTVQSYKRAGVSS